VFGLLLFACVATLPGGICLPSVKSKCVGDCSVACGIVGSCIFGCELGQVNSVDQCYIECGPDNVCLNACLQTVSCITDGCGGDVTANMAIKQGALVYNRSLGIWQQTVLMTNKTGKTVTNPVFILTSLVPGWTLINGDGMTQYDAPGSPYKKFGTVPADATATITLQFSRSGAPAFSYTPEVEYGQVP